MDGEGAFDLVTLCDVLHDLPAPVPLLRAISARMADSGVLLAIEPKVADQLEENIHPLGAMFHGFSVFHCLTQSLAQHGAGLGACIGPTRTIALLREGGFEHVEILAIRSPTNLFYAARR
jgi:2-polyprenyl-3-methyl-5-hydroxy-6-metoxy-1,4-benzoquinol methylase